MVNLAKFFASFFKENCKKVLTNGFGWCIIRDVKGNGVFEFADSKAFFQFFYKKIKKYKK